MKACGAINQVLIETVLNFLHRFKLTAGLNLLLDRRVSRRCVIRNSDKLSESRLFESDENIVYGLIGERDEQHPLLESSQHLNKHDYCLSFSTSRRT